ncbi:MAG: 50S ribosomal protein L9, partial [Cycloclasticus sp.]
MNIILLEKVANLGNLGDKVSVKPGFGRNFLIPGGKAVLATPERIKEFEARRAELEKAEVERLTKAQQRADIITALSLTITHQAGE